MNLGLYLSAGAIRKRFLVQVGYATMACGMNAIESRAMTPGGVKAAGKSCSTSRSHQ